MKLLCTFSSCLVVCATSMLPAQTASSANMGAVQVGSSTIATVTVNIPYAGTLTDIAVSTGGAANKDFLNAGGGTCKLQTSYAKGDTCTVKVRFRPLFPGARYGGILLSIEMGGFAIAEIQGTGLAPQTAFPSNAPKQIASVLNLSGLAVDGQGNVFYASGEYFYGYGGPSLEHWGYVNGLRGALPWFSPWGIVTSGAGIVCVNDEAGIEGFVAVPGSGYQFDPYPNVCPGIAGASVTDGAGNFYGLPGPTKQTLQPNGSFVLSTIANLAATGIAVDGNGNVYVAAGELYKETPQRDGTYTQTVISTNLTGIGTVELDGIGNLYLGTSTGFFKEALQPDGTYNQSVIHTGLTNATIWTADQHGDLFLSTPGALYDPAGMAGTPGFMDNANFSNVYELNISDPPALSFAATTPGLTSSDSPQVVTVANNGNETLQFTSVLFPADYPQNSAETTDCKPTTTLAPGSTCTLSIDFQPLGTTGNPAKPRLLNEQVLITTNTLSKPRTKQAIKLTGTEAPSIVATTTTLTVSPTTLKVGESATITVIVKPTSGTAVPTGTITLVSAQESQTWPLDSTGKFQVTTALNIPPGTYTLTAVYNGSAHFSPSKSASLTRTLLAK